MFNSATCIPPESSSPKDEINQSIIISFGGIGVGAAYYGLKPVVEFMMINFSLQVKGPLFTFVICGICNVACGRGVLLQWSYGITHSVVFGIVKEFFPKIVLLYGCFIKLRNSINLIDRLLLPMILVG